MEFENIFGNTASEIMNLNAMASVNPLDSSSTNNNKMRFNIFSSNNSNILDDLSKNNGIMFSIQNEIGNNYKSEPSDYNKAIIRYPFVLRNINPHEIYREYKAGLYENLKIDSSALQLAKSSNHISSGDGIIPDTNDQSRERYYKTNNGTTSTIVTAGQKDYELACSKLDDPYNINLGKDGICSWCRAKLKERLSSYSYPIGIPTSIKLKGSTYIFNTLGTMGKTCSFGCALSYAESKPQYAKYVPNIKFMFNLINPDRELKRAPDWEFHKRNGGTINDAEFYNNDTFFVKTGNIITLPTKTEYLMINRMQLNN